MTNAGVLFAMQFVVPNQLWVASETGTKIWNLEGKELIHSVSSEMGLNLLKVHDHIWVSEVKNINIFHANTFQKEHTLDIEESTLMIRVGESHVWAFNSNKSIIVVDIFSFCMVGSINVDARLKSMAEVEEHVWAATWSGQIQIWDSKSWKMIKTIDTDTKMYCLTYVDSILWCGTWQSAIYGWCVQEFSKKFEVSGYQEDALASLLAFWDNVRSCWMICTASRDCSICVFKLQSSSFRHSSSNNS